MSWCERKHVGYIIGLACNRRLVALVETEMAAAAGLRWTVEECFLRAQDDLGLDHCEARSWHGWHRHVTLVMAAAAFLIKLAADQRRKACSKGDKTSPNAAAA